MAETSRRRFIQGAASVSLAAHQILALAASSDTGEFLLVGTQTTATSKGIYAYRFDTATGELQQSGLAAETNMPSFLILAPNGKNIFSVNEVEEYHGKKSGSVSSFTLDRKTEKLKAINQAGVRLAVRDKLRSRSIRRRAG